LFVCGSKMQDGSRGTKFNKTFIGIFIWKKKSSLNQLKAILAWTFLRWSSAKFRSLKQICVQDGHHCRHSVHVGSFARKSSEALSQELGTWLTQTERG
jgi:hypothetical protein